MPLSSSANRRKDLRKTAKYTINWLQHIAIISMTRVIFNRPLFTYNTVCHLMGTAFQFRI